MKEQSKIAKAWAWLQARISSNPSKATKAIVSILLVVLVFWLSNIVIKLVGLTVLVRVLTVAFIFNVWLRQKK